MTLQIKLLWCKQIRIKSRKGVFVAVKNTSTDISNTNRLFKPTTWLLQFHFFWYMEKCKEICMKRKSLIFYLINVFWCILFYFFKCPATLSVLFEICRFRSAFLIRHITVSIKIPGWKPCYKRDIKGGRDWWTGGIKKATPRQNQSHPSLQVSDFTGNGFLFLSFSPHSFSLSILFTSVTPLFLSSSHGWMDGEQCMTSSRSYIFLYEEKHSE